MKKAALFTFLSAISCVCAYSAFSSSDVSNVKATGEKETVLFDFKDEAAMNDSYIRLNTNIELPAYSQTSFSWYLNLEAQESAALASNGASSSINLSWNGLRPADGSLPYKHFQIKAGTVIAENDTTQYVLRNDYNFWWTQHSGAVGLRGWLFQHGGADALAGDAKTNYEILSLSFKGDLSPSGPNDDLKRWNFYVPYEKETGPSTSEEGWNGNISYVDSGEGYNLVDFSSDFINVTEPISSGSRGTVLMCINYTPLGLTNGTDFDHHISFYFPKGTLFGGAFGSYAFMIEEDAYLEAYSNGTVAGVFSSPHDYVKHDGVCGHPGNLEYYTCSRHADEGEVFVKDGDNYVKTTLDKVQIDVEHSFTFVEGKPYTCDIDGVAAHYECSNCHKLALKEGEDYRLVESDELIIPAAHTLVHHDEIPFTCESDGKHEYEECSVCHKFYISDDGELAEVEESELIIAKHHVPVTVDGKEATCLEAGYTAAKKCSVCDEVIEESKEIPALGHRYGGWKVDDDGEHISHYCERCYQVETVSLANNQDFTYTVIKEATSYSKGLALYSSDKYGSFYVELPMASSKGNATTTNIIISGVLAAVAVGVFIGGFFILKKKFPATK